MKAERNSRFVKQLTTKTDWRRKPTRSHYGPARRAGRPCYAGAPNLDTRADRGYLVRHLSLRVPVREVYHADVMKKPYVPPRFTRYAPKIDTDKLNPATPTLLICDDNPNIRHLLRVYVESRTPFEVCGEAEHGMEAIEKAKELQPDLILLDLSMPIMTGAEAAVILKRIVPRMKIILFSMQVDDVSRSVGAAIGVDLTLSKSDGISKLADHLHALLT